MSAKTLDLTTRRLLGLLQSGFPICREPYTELGRKLGLSPEEIMNRIEQLKASGIVRQISPVFDARKLGYQSILVALKVPAKWVQHAEKILASYPGISHGYEREHEFNIWITLSIPGKEELSEILDEISSRTRADEILALPATRVFKLRTNFCADDVISQTDVPNGTALAQETKLTELERRIINGLQRDLPLAPDPFAPIARELHISVTTLLHYINSLLAEGVIRRYGASINHYRAGYLANAMTCWKVPKRSVEMVGRRLASYRQVSHCYERQAAKNWRHNIFAMVHGESRADCLRIINGMAKQTALKDYIVLFSRREFIKTRIRYNV